MKTDTLFYKIFQSFPHLVFELLDRSVVTGYAFTSVEVKEKSFRFDGIFMPPIDASEEPIFFIEVQFQSNPSFYWEFLSEIFLYLNQQKPIQDWVAVAIFPDRARDTENLSTAQQEMVNSGRIKRIYLDELPDRSLVEFAMLRLITCPEERAVEVVDQIRSGAMGAVILDFVRTILVYKFPRMSREEIEKMFTLDDLRQTRFYQESFQDGKQQGKLEGRLEGKLEGRLEGKLEGRLEGKQLGEAGLLIRLLSRKFGTLPPDRVAQISSLPIDRLEELGEALLDFATIDELHRWLDNYSPTQNAPQQ